MSSYTYYTVDIQNRYGLDGPGIESRWARDFLHLSKPALWPNQPPRQGVPRLSRGKSGRDLELTTYPYLAPRLNKRVELYLHSSSGPSWPVTGRILRFYHTYLQEILRMVYFSCFHFITNYGLIFWGNSSYNVKPFWIRKNIIRIMGHVHARIYWRN